MSRVKGLLKREEQGRIREEERERERRERRREARGDRKGVVAALSRGVEERVDREGKGSTPYLYSGSPSSSTAFIFPIKVVI